MKKISIISNIITGIFITGCSLSFAPYPANVYQSNAKIRGDINGENAYKNYKVFTGIEIAGRTIEGVLADLSSYQNKNYVYKSSYHIVFPNNIDVKITNLKELKTAVETYTPFTLMYEKRPYNTCIVISKVKNSRQMRIKKTKDTLENILKEIANAYNANLIIDKNTFKKGELGEYDNYILNSNTVFDLQEAVSAYHNVFIEYNPYNRSVKVFKYKYIEKVLPGFNKQEIEGYLDGVFQYDETLNKLNSFYINKDGLVTVKTTYSNYYNAVRVLNALKKLNNKNLNFELNYFKVKSLDKIPYSILTSEIKSCGNYKCVKSVIENYGNIINLQKNYATSKINRTGTVLSKKGNSEIEFDYKIFPNSLKNKDFIINYAIYNHKKNTLNDNSAIIKGSQIVSLNTYIPVYIKITKKNGIYTEIYYIIKISSPIP